MISIFFREKNEEYIRIFNGFFRGSYPDDKLSESPILKRNPKHRQPTSLPAVQKISFVEIKGK